MNMNKSVAQALLEINAVGFSLEKPIVFKSGIISPVYVDNRKLPFFPTNWKTVLEALALLIEESRIEFDVVAGIETAGIPHSAALGFMLKKPSVFVRKQAKDHGTKKMVEGGDVRGKRVLLIEDHVTTGGSSLAGVKSLRAEGAIVTDCLSITSYEFEEVTKAFGYAQVTLHTATTFQAILTEAVVMKKMNEVEMATVKNWLGNPHDWGK